MRFKNLLLILWVLSLLSSGCNQNPRKDDGRAEEMISARTLGLAYLEENKLEEARDEFLKLVKLDPKEVLGYANLGIVYLRMGNYPEAEDWLQQAIKMDPQDPDVRLILAKVYEMSEQPLKSIDELKKIIGFSPGHVKALYQLTELYSTSADPESLKSRHKYLNEMVNSVPGNMVPRLNLTELLIRNGQLDQALEQMEKLQQLFPEFPKESIEFHDKTIAALRAGDGNEAAVSFMIFHNYMKVTSPYQAGILDLKGPGGSLIGFPVITFDQTKTEILITDWETLLESIKFTDITSTAGLGLLIGGKETDSKSEAETGRTHLSACDFDGDGDTDLYAGRFDPQAQSYKHYLFLNDWGIFTDGGAKAGIRHQGPETTGRFADYDNDGFHDLYIVKEGSDILYRNRGDGTFTEVSDKAKLGEGSQGTSSLFFDFDHDGDLDLFVTRQGPNLLYRNNADGSFTEQAEKSGLSGGSTLSCDAGFGDFDDDGGVVNPDDPWGVSEEGGDRVFWPVDKN